MDGDRLRAEPVRLPGPPGADEAREAARRVPAQPAGPAGPGGLPARHRRRSVAGLGAGGQPGAHAAGDPPRTRRPTLTMDHLGPIVAWRALQEGTPVYDPDGKAVSVVEKVLAPGGIFEGIVLHTRPLPGRH